MPAVLVDSNVILDILTEDPRWFAWSARALEEIGDKSVVAINPIIYAEVSVRFSTVEALEEALPAIDFQRLPIPWAAAFLAAKVFVRYRRRAGTKSRPLPDFFIGAHAAVSGLKLLTRDPERYRSYFPRVRLIAPQA